MKLIALDKDDQNEAWIDPWSAVHGATGLAFGLTGVNFWISLTAALVFDVAEQLFEKHPAGQRFFATSGPESLGNVATDLVLFIGGWWLGQKYNGTASGSGRARNFGRLTRGRRRRRLPRGQRQRRGTQRVSRGDAMYGAIGP